MKVIFSKIALIFLLLSFLFNQSQATDSWDQSFQLTSEDLQVLQTHIDAVRITEALNASFVENLRKCYCLVHQDELNNCDPGDQLDLIEKKYIDTQGSTQNVPMSCAQAVDAFVDQRIKTDIKKMRLSLSLAKPELDISGGNIKHFAYNFMTNRLPQKALINTKIQHPLESVIPKLEPLTAGESKESELSEAIASFDNLREKICKFFTKVHSSKIEKANQGIPTNCKELLIALTSSKASPQNRHDRNELLNSFLDFTFEKLNSFRSKYQDEYLNIVNRNPMVLYIKNLNPSVSDTYKALSDLSDNAKKRLQAEKTQSPLWIMSEKWALPYTRALLKKRFPDRDFEPTIADLINRGEKYSDYKSYASTGLVLAGVAVCQVVPAGKVVKLLSVLFKGRTVCQAGYGLSLNSLFTMEVFIRENISLKKFLVAVEGSRSPIRAEDLVEIEKEKNFALLTFPAF